MFKRKNSYLCFFNLIFTFVFLFISSIAQATFQNISLSQIEGQSAEELEGQSSFSDDQNVRILVTSDNHNLIHMLPFGTVLNESQANGLSLTQKRELAVSLLPEVDVMVVAGDFTDGGTIRELRLFRAYLDEVLKQEKAKHIVLVSGNHDISLDPNQLDRLQYPPQCNSKDQKESYKREFEKLVAIGDKFKIDLLETKRIHYLEDTSVTLFGLKFYGTPWLPFCNYHAFCAPRSDISKGSPFLAGKWSKIPEDTDVLITHAPARGILDIKVDSDEGKFDEAHFFQGCSVLRDYVLNKLPNLKLHAFGHVHEKHGALEYTDEKDNTRYFINGAMKSMKGKAEGLPILIRLPSKIK